MTKKHTIVLSVVMFLAGVLAGGGLTYFGASNQLNKSLELHEAASILSTVQALRALHRDDTVTGFTLLETHMNGALITFCASPPSTRESAMAIEEAKKYRQAHPFNGGQPDIDDAIAKLLSH